MHKKDLILVGGGGHCRSCIAVIEGLPAFNIVGILDVEATVGQRVLGYEIIGTDAMIPELAAKDCVFLITVGQIKSATARTRIFEKIISSGAALATVIASTAMVSRHATIGEGSIVMHFAVVNANTTIGRNCIINTRADIEHDCVISDHIHVSTGAIINGDCVVGEQTFIGSGAVVANSINIAKQVVIGAGTVINKSILESGTYTGNPFRPIKK